MSAVSAKNLTVRFGNQTILDRLNFEVAKGSVTAVIGPNGSGKTTLFRALLGFVHSEGIVKIFQKPVQESLPRISYVPQRFDFDRSLPITVNEFLSFASPTDASRAQEVCHEVKADKLADKLIGELSGGELQRVLIAQALIKEPDLLFLDEPSAGIDIEGAKTFYELIRHVNQEHEATIMLISHDVGVVYEMADQVLCVKKTLVANGPPRQVLTKDVLQKLFGQPIGWSAPNL
ncbi:MAG: metal ABC transporter ATP-binding protein [Patescibacteria group bacterium]|nr:metal ABC transporter ATP-binding protein [Patescibacteria group bacterium]